ncbi:PAS domain S-box protein [Methanolobus sp. ZRKC3]|uniref:PAS domain S-box protein n=1 Tax=Methanolobus sp. ZRKC3 TaxID=3125786 RepID=UPI00324A0D22
MPEGSYFSLLYNEAGELEELLCAFFDAGLKNNECCVWGLSGRMDRQVALDILKGAGIDADTYLKTGQIMLIPCEECYVAGEDQISERELQHWEELYEGAMSAGFDGLRMFNEFTIVGDDAWKAFVEFEKKGMDIIQKRGVIAIFAFLEEARSRSELIELIGMHDGTIIKKNDTWALLQSSSFCKTVQKEARFPDDILENVWTGVWATDRHDNIVYFNKGMESISGLLRKNVLGKKLVKFISQQPEEDELTFIDIFQMTKESLHSRNYDIFPFVKPNGQYIYHSGVLFPLADEHGDYAGMFGTIGKLVEQRISRETLRDKFKSIEKLEDIYRKSPVIAFLWTTEEGWPIEFVSDNISQFGYTPEELVSGNLVYSDLVHPDDVDHVIKDATQLEISGKMYFLNEYRLLTKSGNPRWVTERSYLIRDEAGNPVYYQGIIIDITERKKADEAIVEAEKKYRMIFENSPLGIFNFNKNGIITHCNKKFLEIMGLEKREDIIGFDMVASIVDARMKKAVDDVLSRKVGHFEGEYHTVSSDVTITIKADYSPNIAEDGTLLGGIGVFQDISKRKKAEDALRLDESRLEALLKLNQMTSMSFKEISNFVQEEGVRMTQSKIGYLAFLDDANVLIMHSWSKNAMKICAVDNRRFEYPLETTGIWGEAIRQRKPIITNDFQAPNPLKKGYPLGHIKILRHMNIPIFDGDKIVGVAGVGNKESEYDQSDVRQLTLLMEGMWRLIQRKKAEDTLREYAREISSVNEELSRTNEELSNANEELKSLDRMKDEFLSNVSHEFKTPLTSIQGYSQLISDGTLGDVNEQQRKAVETVIRNSERLRRLVDSLLYLSRAQAGKIRYSFDHLRIADVIDNSIQDIALQAESKNITIKKDVPDELPVITADKDKLMDVFINLIDNAIKFTPENGTITVSSNVDGESLHLSVKDTGIGIPESKIPNLFQRFYQIDSSVKRKYGGTGLGLYICRKIVEDHGGNIWVESTEGEGSTFHIMLPL